jgi:hypothetical protein
VADVPGDSLTGLLDPLLQLLAQPPVTEKKLLELRAEWSGLSPGRARMAEALRLFVITWDPLELRVPRPAAFAAVNIDPLELAVYLPCWSLTELAAEQGMTMAAVLGAVAGTVVMTGAANRDVVISGQYPDLARKGKMPDLVGDPAAGSALGQAGLRVVSPQWESIGLGAIADIVQHAFGPVDLDRSPVELNAAASRPGCPACAGRRFDFPAELAEARDRMCRAHRAEAEAVITRRLVRPETSNPDGWGALGAASRRLEQPHLPNGRAAKLAGARDAMYVIPEPEELAVRARLVIEAAGWFPGRAQDFAIALGEEPESGDVLPEWLMNLVLDLGRAGLGTEAVMVGEALGLVDPEQRATFDADAAVALAEAGLAEEARARVAANLARWPGDVWIRVHAGDTLATLGDREGAAGHFSAAAEMADDADDFTGRSDAMARLMRLRRSSAEDTPGQRTVRRQLRKAQSRAQRRRKR